MHRTGSGIISRGTNPGRNRYSAAWLSTWLEPRTGSVRRKIRRNWVALVANAERYLEEEDAELLQARVSWGEGATAGSVRVSLLPQAACMPYAHRLVVEVEIGDTHDFRS
jgi:hypothetical protein